MLGCQCRVRTICLYIQRSFSLVAPIYRSRMLLHIWGLALGEESSHHPLRHPSPRASRPLGLVSLWARPLASHQAW